MPIYKRCVHCQTAFSPTSVYAKECEHCLKDGPFYTHIEMQLEAPQPELDYDVKEGSNGGQP